MHVRNWVLEDAFQIQVHSELTYILSDLGQLGVI